MLLKVSLILGVEIHVNVEFTGLVEPQRERSDNGERTHAVVCVSYRAAASLIADGRVGGGGGERQNVPVRGICSGLQSIDSGC